MKQHLHWGQLITQFHRWIPAANQTWGALMLEWHCSIRRYACMAGTEHTNSEANRWCPGMTTLRTVNTSLARHKPSPVLVGNSFTAINTGTRCVLLQLRSVVSVFPEGLSPDSPANRAVRCHSGLYKSEYATVCRAAGRQTVLCTCVCSTVQHPLHMMISYLMITCHTQLVLLKITSASVCSVQWKSV